MFFNIPIQEVVQKNKDKQEDIHMMRSFKKASWKLIQLAAANAITLAFSTIPLTGLASGPLIFTTIPLNIY